MKKILLLLLAVVVAIILPVIILQFSNDSFVENIADTSILPKKEIFTPSPSLEEKVGQLFIIGHWSDTITSDTTKLVDDLHLGGVIIMDVVGDTRKVKGWTNEWQNVAYPTPLLIGIDQEGGIVSRLKESSFIQLAQPEITTLDIAYETASKRAKELSELGINNNFAPVVDQSINPDAFMYERVFRDPVMISSLADTMVRGYQNGGVVSTPKHYPGHPDTADDSHITLPILNLSEEEYRGHTEQFSELLKAGNTQMLMTAHVQVPTIDSVYPTTLSNILITDLRTRIGYDGVIVTDDLAMQAISDRWSYEDAAVLSLQAGADMIMLAAEPEYASSTIQAVITAVESGELAEERINEAYERVILLKERL